MLIDGRAIAATIRADVAERVQALRDTGLPVALAIVVATDDESTNYYVRSLTRTAERLAIDARIIQVDRAAGADEIRTILSQVSADPAVHGVICQTPLPGRLRLEDVGEAIVPEADVDGANPTSIGRLVAGVPGAFAPATAAAVMAILDAAGVELAGRQAVVIGRSNVVGKPASALLLARDATVTVCHSRTVDLPGVARRADILVAAVGRAGFVTAEFVKPGAVVVDVGTNATADGGLTGDVDTVAVEPIARAVTPVPGGVGAVTTALLMSHVVDAAERAKG